MKERLRDKNGRLGDKYQIITFLECSTRFAHWEQAR